MPNSRDAIIQTLKDARAYVEYLDELGVETVDSLGETHAISHADTSSAAPRATSTGVSVSVSAPIEQNVVRISDAERSVRIAAPPQTSFFDQSLLDLTGFAAPTETLDEIWQDIGDCTRCGLCEGRTQVVNTHGNRNARLMFVGEAPGADEDAQGKPFVGRAGQLLTKIIEAIGLKREDVIIGNVNRCRPPGNRQPTLEEAAICRPFLFREIVAVRPEVIVVMGNTALRNLLEIREGITRVRGQFQDFQGIKVMPTFHPAYLLRDPSKKRETWEDMKKVKAYLDSRETQRSGN
ncbi:MAG TPA: uracil-DNA glycosylase [Pyrinomonadaceae bacterium]|nr:uracil-DNA glycosylase [Pyrinomonadaceae bacterium]